MAGITGWKLRAKRGTEQSGRKPSSTCILSNDSISETDAPYTLKVGAKNRPMNDLLDMPPNKQLEQQVLHECSKYLTENLPADDVAPEMASQDLLTPREDEKYKALKRSGESTIGLSEYLLECLQKRRGGFLKRFCTILWKIEAAKYLGDHIRDAYNLATVEGGFNPSSRDRISRMSLSDPEINQRSKDNITQSCAACKKLKKRNRQLNQRLIELEKDLNQLQEAKIKIETHLTTLQDQLKQEELERKDLTRLVPQLHEASTLIDRYSRVVEVSGAQQTLKRINNLMHDQTKNLTATVRSRNRPESTLSILSDASSIAESYTAEEDVTQSTCIFTCNSEKNKVTKGIASQPVPGVSSSRHTCVSTTGIIHTKNTEDTVTPTQMSASTPGSSQELIKESSLRHVHSESTPSMSDSRTIQRANTHPKKSRHHSVSNVAENFVKQGRSQSFKHDYVSHGPMGPQAYLTCNQELQSKLNKQRKKIESQSEFSERHAEHQSQ